MKIGEKIRQIRKNAGQTQEAVAQRLEIGADALSRHENGHRFPDHDFLFKFCRLFNVSSDWLLFDEEPVYRTPLKELDVNKMFLELKSAVEKQKGIKPSPTDVVNITLETLGSDPDHIIPMLEYMLKDKVLCRNMLQFFYLFQKPESDRRQTATQNTQKETG